MLLLLFSVLFAVGILAQPVEYLGSKQPISAPLNGFESRPIARRAPVRTMAFGRPPIRPNPFRRPKIGSHYLFRDLLDEKVWQRPDTPRQEIMDTLFRISLDQLNRLGSIYSSPQFQRLLDREANYLWTSSNYFMLPFVYEYYFENSGLHFAHDQAYHFLKRVFEYTRYMGNLPKKIASDIDHQYELKRCMYQMYGILETPAFVDEFAPMLPGLVTDYIAAASISPLLREQYHTSKMAKILVICLRYLHTSSVRQSSDIIMDDFVAGLSGFDVTGKRLFLEIVQEAQAIEKSIELMDAESIAYHIPVSRFYAKLMDAWPQMFFDVAAE